MKSVTCLLFSWAELHITDASQIRHRLARRHLSDVKIREIGGRARATCLLLLDESVAEVSGTISLPDRVPKQS